MVNGRVGKENAWTGERVGGVGEREGGWVNECVGVVDCE